MTNNYISMEDEENQSLICPNCSSEDIIMDNKRGETICSICGLVIEERLINFDSEWRAYDQEEYKKRARAENPHSLMNDNLSTLISFENTDALGHSISLDKKNEFYRLRKWQLRVGNLDSKSINLHKANKELDRLCSQLEIPRIVKQTAGTLYKKAYDAGALKGYPIDDMIAASVYASARIRRLPRTLEEISNATQSRKKRIGQCYRLLVTRMNFRIPPIQPSDLIIRIGTELGLSANSQRFAVKIIEKASMEKLTIGKDPCGIAAAALYLAGIVKGEKRSQLSIAQVSHITEVTIRHTFKTLVSVSQDSSHM